MTVPDMGWAAKDVTDSIVLTLVELCETATVPPPLRDPSDLAYSIVEQACSLRWSVRSDGQHTDRRARELAAYLLGFLLARARAGELDVTAGDAA